MEAPWLWWGNQRERGVGESPAGPWSLWDGMAPGPGWAVSDSLPCLLLPHSAPSWGRGGWLALAGCGPVLLAGWGSRCTNKEATACLMSQGHRESQYLFAKWKRSAESLGGFCSNCAPPPRVMAAGLLLASSQVSLDLAELSLCSAPSL